MIINVDQAGMNAIVTMMTKGMKSGAYDPNDLEGLTMIKRSMKLIEPEKDEEKKED